LEGTSRQNYLSLSIGLGIGVFVLVIIIIVISSLIWWKRKQIFKNQIMDEVEELGLIEE